ncbi:MAG: hypothetical protein J7507_03470, partial [Pseudoxanthomonas sp.]|nr:hypothetical protein [Pseudoxanthomonas sp.]
MILRTNDPVLIPVVSMLLQTDVQAMICCDYPRAIFLTQLEAYERWLEELVGPSDQAASVVQERIVRFKETQARLHADVPKLAFDTMCFARRWSEKHSTGRQQQYWIAERAEVNVYSVTYTEQVALRADQVADVDRLLDEHPGDGPRLLDRTHLPYVLVHKDNARQASLASGWGVINGAFSSNTQVIAHSQVKHLLSSLAACTTDSNKHADA